MIGSYRIHQEQIKKVEQSLRAPYLIRKGDAGVCDRSGAGNRQVKRQERDSTRRKSPAREMDAGRSAPGNKQVHQDPPTPPSSPVPALRCLRCNTRIPELDFLYTNKSGLCICCWEEQEVCI
jgi:hypothetical protein